MLKAVVFDRDGVLADFDLARARAALGPLLPFDLDALGRRIREHAARVGPPRDSPGERAFWRGFVQALAAEIDLGEEARSRLERFEPRAALAAHADARPALERARGRGLRVGVLSNFTLLDLRGSLAAIGLADLVDAALSAATIGASKPSPAAYHAIAGALDVPPAECLFVDDRPEHVAGATAVGMRAVLLARPPREATGAALRGLDELDRWLDGDALPTEVRATATCPGAASPRR